MAEINAESVGVVVEEGSKSLEKLKNKVDDRIENEQVNLKCVDMKRAELDAVGMGDVDWLLMLHRLTKL